MNSSPENISSSGNNEDSSSSLEPIDDLLDLLLDSEDWDAPVSEQNVSDHLNSLANPKLGKEAVASEPEAIARDLKYTEIEVEIEDTEPTLTEAVEYEAFLRQTVEPDRTDPLENLATIDPANASTEDLADAVNILIPLIVELLQFKLNDSKEGIIQTVRPVLDRLIEERTTEDSQKMAVAIAKILPSAISEGIELTPEKIARAIAPEIALSIREQIRLDKDAISSTLGPEMGKAIKAQIELERDAMVDALYPVIGSTISKYMVEVVQEINRKVESTLSPAGLRRKIRAKVQGVSEAELIFKESLGYHVRAIFLIDKDSGLVIQEIQIPGEKHLDSDMIAGMLTAIRSFANDCISAGSELDLIDYGDWQIPLEVAGYCYLAVVIAGEPPKQFINKIRQIMGEIVLEYGEAIQNFDGNLANVPSGVRAKLEQLSESEKDKPKKSSPALLWLLIFILGLILIPWGIVSYRARTAHQIEQTVAIQLDAAPELSVYRLDSQVKNGKLTLSGRVPSEYLRDRATAITQKIANRHQLQLDNQIVAVEVPINPSLVTGEIARLTSLFNQRSRVNIATTYQPKTLIVEGFILDKSARQTISRGFAQIPGVEQIIFKVVEQLPEIGQRIYFELGSSKLNFADNFSKIDALARVLQQYSQLHLKLNVHSDGRGSSKINQRLSKERCQNVKNALVARGIESTRLVVDCDSLLLPIDGENNRALWSNRYVNFQPFIPTKLSQ